jgi:2-isopropylmalate synthase
LVQGTINGIGERCGNANLISIIPGVMRKLGLACLTKEQLLTLTETSRYVTEIANQVPRDNQPYVGNSAFAHKGGVHVSAVSRHSGTYEHITPESVGNKRRVLVSELAGRSNMVLKAREFNLDLEKHPEAVDKIIHQVKLLENQGYHFEGAEASFYLLVMRLVRPFKPFFDLKGFRVIVEEDKDVRRVGCRGDVEGGCGRENRTPRGGRVRSCRRVGPSALRLALGKILPETEGP